MKYTLTVTFSRYYTDSNWPALRSVWVVTGLLFCSIHHSSVAQLIFNTFIIAGFTEPTTTMAEVTLRETLQIAANNALAQSVQPSN